MLSMGHSSSFQLEKNLYLFIRSFTEKLQSATKFIWNQFEQPVQRKGVQQLTTFLETKIGVTYSTNNEIHSSADYMADSPGDLKAEITGLLFLKMTHGMPGLKGVQPGQGDRWDQGYAVTAWFLDYCYSLRDGFVVELNARMRNDYSDN
ncbi:basic secretory protein [Dillenia turbinata]|uniref:Basic secretory protein n=1 Tax=Dillenia turbinata TaxID=194707 RepID=A0AAN8ZUW3_9MAGN